MNINNSKNKKNGSMVHKGLERLYSRILDWTAAVFYWFVLVERIKGAAISLRNI